MPKSKSKLTLDSCYFDSTLGEIISLRRFMKSKSDDEFKAELKSKMIRGSDKQIDLEILKNISYSKVDTKEASSMRKVCESMNKPNL